MNVRFSLKARLDLVEIGVFIAEDSVARAEAFANELEGVCGALAGMPRAFPIVPRYRRRKLRRRAYRDYLIFYVAGMTDVEIVRILHGARDYDRLLSGK